jgi:hypothetical protein
VREIGWNTDSLAFSCEPVKLDAPQRFSFSFLFPPFFMLYVYDGTGDRFHIDLGDVF